MTEFSYGTALSFYMENDSVHALISNAEAFRKAGQGRRGSKPF